MKTGTLLLLGVGAYLVYKMGQAKLASPSAPMPSLTQTAQQAANTAAADLIKQAQDAISSINISGMC